MITLEGFIDNIIFRNEENGYTVFEVVADGERRTCVGSFQYIHEGEYIDLTGNETVHPGYGEQIQIKSYEIKAPADEIAMERYLASGAIKGIGKRLRQELLNGLERIRFVLLRKNRNNCLKLRASARKKPLRLPVRSWKCVICAVR